MTSDDLLGAVLSSAHRSAFAPSNEGGSFIIWRLRSFYVDQFSGSRSSSHTRISAEPIDRPPQLALHDWMFFTLEARLE